MVTVGPVIVSEEMIKTVFYSKIIIIIQSTDFVLGKNGLIFYVILITKRSWLG